MTGTIDDLRATLAGHADDLADRALPGRGAAVAARVTRVRRRRRSAVGAGVAAALVAAVLGVTTYPGHDGAQPAGVPDRVEVYGFGYRLDHTIPVEVGHRGLTARLPVGDRDYALVLAGSGLGAGDATLYVGDQPAERVSGDEVSAAYPVDADSATGLQVRLTGAPADAEASVAVYTRTDTMPAGVTGSGTVYRQRVGSRTLLGAVVGRPGQTRLTFDFDADGPWGISEECATPAKHAWLQVEIDGRPFAGRGCGQGGPLPQDAALAGLDSPAHPAPGHHTVRLYLTATASSTTPIEVPGTRISGAAYDDREASQVAGMRISRVTEFAGREWRVAQVVPVPDGARSFTRSVTTGEEPARIGYVVHTDSMVMLRARATGHPADDQQTGVQDATGGVSLSNDTLLLPHDTYEVSMRAQGPGEPHLGGALVIYRPID